MNTEVSTKKQRMIVVLDYIVESIVYVVIWIPYIIDPDKADVVITALIVLGASVLLKCWRKMRGKIPYKEKVERVRRIVEKVMMALAWGRLLILAVMEFEFF